MARLFIEQALASPRSANHDNLITEQVRKVQIILKHGHIEPNSLIQHTPFFIEPKFRLSAFSCPLMLSMGDPLSMLIQSGPKTHPKTGAVVF